MLKLLHKNLSLVLILILALGLRLPLLNGSFWLDEAAQALESTRPLAQQLQIRDDFQPPLLHLIVHFWSYLGTSEWWLRLGGAFIPGLMTILAVYQLARKKYSPQTASLTTVLLALSSFHVFYSQELRQYSLPAMFAALSWWVLVEWQPLKKGKSKWRWPVLFGLLSLAGFYSSYLYPFLFLAQVVYWLLSRHSQLRQQISEMVLSWGIVGLGFAPWLPSFFDQLAAGRELQTSLPGWSGIVGFSQFKSLVLVAGKFLFGVVSLQEKWLWLAGAVLAVMLAASAVALLKGHSTLKKNWATFLLPVCWLVIPIVTAWLVSFVIPILQPKRVLFCLPALFLGLAVLIEQLQKQAKMLAGGLIMLLLAIQALSLYQYWTVPKYQREDWRSLTQEITTTFSSATSVTVFSFPEAFAPWRWYNQHHFPSYATGVLTMSAFSDETSFKKLAEYDTIIVFDYLRDLSDPEHQIEQKLGSLGYVQVGQLEKPNIGFARIFQRKSATYASRN